MSGCKTHFETTITIKRRSLIDTYFVVFNFKHGFYISGIKEKMTQISRAISAMFAFEENRY